MDPWSPISRRRFLRLVGAGAAAAALSTLPIAPAAAAVGGRRGRGESVVVLGGGLAGLCAAWELRQKGYRIEAILEAQGRTGGRVRTVRQGFRHGQYAELGATRIASSHYYTLGYAEQFGLPLIEFSDGDGLYYLKGTPPFVHTDGTAWPSSVLPGLVGADATLGADSIVWKYDQGDVISDPGSPGYLGDPRTALWPLDNANAVGLIPTSYHDNWLANGGSEDGLLVNRAINGSEIYSDGALYWLGADIVDATWSRTFAIRGGNDQLPAAFTRDLGDVVRYHSVVTGIEHDVAGVSVTFHRGATQSTIRADHAVCALPFSVLRDIPVTPAWDGDKGAAITGTRYMPVSRNFMQVRSRFWTAQGIGGLKVARTDTGVDRLWHNTDIQDGPTGILNAYMQNQTGLDYAAAGGSFAERTEYVLDIVSEFFPEIRSEYMGGIEKIWQADPFVKGAWGWFAAGEEDLLPAAKAPVGRVHFCGEHTSVWSGWMQGAFESANRVVNEITGG
jgi:monoamine oxidase